MNEHNIKIDDVVPIGGSMRLSLLKNMIQEQMKSVMRKQKPLCMTVNMDEDISAGACRMSHLFVDNRLQVDLRLQDKTVFQITPSSESIFCSEKDHKQYFITCTDWYLQGIDRSRWHALDGLTEEEEKQMKESTVYEWFVI